MCYKIVNDNKWEKDQQELELPSTTVVDEYLQKLRSRSNIEKGILDKIHIELSNSEIEEDLIIMTSHPPPQKPIKMPNVVQNRLKVSILLFSCNHPWFQISTNGQNWIWICIWIEVFKFIYQNHLKASLV